MACYLTAVSPKLSVPGINIVLSVFSFVDRALEKQISSLEDWI